jgi:hypothetical protein
MTKNLKKGQRIGRNPEDRHLGADFSASRNRVQAVGRPFPLLLISHFDVKVS